MLTLELKESKEIIEIVCLFQYFVQFRNETIIIQFRFSSEEGARFTRAHAHAGEGGRFLLPPRVTLMATSRPVSLVVNDMRPWR